MNPDELTTIYAEYDAMGNASQITVTMANATVSAISAIVRMLSQARQPLSPQEVAESDRSLARTKVIIRDPATEKLMADPLNPNVPWQGLSDRNYAQQ